MGYSVVNLFLILGYPCVYDIHLSGLRTLVKDEEEPGTDIITVRTHPNVSRFLQVL